MVAQAGGTPVLLPPLGADVSVLDRLDGLILSGGADVGPERYGQSAHERTQAQDWRDAAEFALFNAAHTRGMPVLGICRGLQVVNAALGGTIHQHLPEVVGHSDYQPSPGVYGEVTVTIEPNSIAGGLLGTSTVAPCYHHQAVDRVAPGLRVTGTSPDGVIEILERNPSAESAAENSPDNTARSNTASSWLLCVQWHPEHNSTDARVVTGLVAAAREYALTQQAQHTDKNGAL